MKTSTDSYCFSQSAAYFAKRAVCHGLVTLSDITNFRDKSGMTMLHHACLNLSGGVTEENVSAIFSLGFDINHTDNNGKTCLSLFMGNLGCPIQFENETILNEQAVLIFLLRQGADPYLVPEGEPNLFQRTYMCHCQGWCVYDEWIDNGMSRHGSYCGDVLDSALSICGKDFLGFRKQYQRIPEYTRFYTRKIFESLWKGREALCPYWNDTPWPPSVDGNDNKLCSCNDLDEEEFTDEETSEGEFEDELDEDGYDESGSGIDHESHGRDGDSEEEDSDVEGGVLLREGRIFCHSCGALGP
jgi:hypothetical protein